MCTCVQVSSELRSVTNARLLTDLGELEQDLVFGDKSSKELINFLAGKLVPYIFLLTCLKVIVYTWFQSTMIL